MTISLSWSVTSQLRSREFPLTARRKSESESKQRIRETEMGLLQTGPRLERRGDEYENGVEREEERVNLRARVRESRGSLAGTARACISSRPVTPLYGTHRASGFSSVFVLGFAPPLPGDRAMTSPTTSSLRPTTKRGQPSAARWRGWYIKSRRSSRARSPRFDAIGLFWSGRGIIGANCSRIMGL